MVSKSTSSLRALAASLLHSHAVLTGNAAAAAAGPQNLIVDTDMGFDVDDMVAVCLANALQDAGKANILAMVHNDLSEPCNIRREGG